ncbi:KpsF/GutQ family sugar-phosphate isomerase [Kiritimatiella glycovorans]|uniref:Arabinose 5-phosphate isomerase KdsD n=1 Tax=Kiritimatiella glycovorans TaxID=1307763 RepID=A0A0G3EFT4_9BACT|nr:SIS domain-containing protein [Kiritimatiella glycovorans]AKJ63670.1 Arabinose 5-phosphate isomerase KdsD [Kiritimatiella glycovorans]
MNSTAMEAACASIEIETRAVCGLEGIERSEAFGQAVDALAACPRIMTCASGSSGIAARKFAHTLCCIERGAMFMPPGEAVHGGLGGLKTEDVMVMVSRGGKTAELMPVIDVCRKKGATLIAVTENLNSILAQAAAIVLPLRIERESDPLDTMATSSFIATIALFDALIAALIEQTGFTRAQFGLIHPGGAVGEELSGDGS